MLAAERLFEIEEAFGEKVQGIVPLELDGETLRLILYLTVSERWHEPAGHRTVAGENTRALQLLLAHLCKRIEDRLG